MSLIVDSSKTTRRDFLKTAAGGSAALVIGFYWPSLAQNQSQEKAPPSPFSAWVRIDRNGQVTLTVAKSEMGQGVMAALPMILAEELDLDWTAVRVEQAATRPQLYGDQGTGGSGSVFDSWTPLRQAGAAGRQMLITAAAQIWGVNPDTCYTKQGAVFHGPIHRRLAYGELVETASKLPVPDFHKVPLKNPDDFAIIGKSVRRPEIPDKVTGKAIFGLDVKVPGMLYAVVARCPTFGGKAARFDAAKAKAVPGVREVVEIPAIGRGAFTAGGVAVVAESTWAAMEGRRALVIEWDRGPHASESSQSLNQQLAAAIQQTGKVIRNDGDAETALASSARKIEAVYELPFLAHATM